MKTFPEYKLTTRETAAVTGYSLHTIQNKWRQLFGNEVKTFKLSPRRRVFVKKDVLRWLERRAENHVNTELLR